MSEPADLLAAISASAPEPWFENAADLLAEPDPGSTPFLVEDLIVDGAVGALVGEPKLGKTWTLLDLAISVVSGLPALGSFAVPRPGPVLVILEESGRAALHRRLDSLVRGRALGPASVSDLYYAANRRVRLDDKKWRARLLEAATAKPWRMILFDPFARVKGATKENEQEAVGPVLDFLRDLREASRAAVLYAHHPPHDGTRQRGSSDLEAYWETKLTLTRSAAKRTLTAEHREAEPAGPFDVSFAFDATTRTLRLSTVEGELVQKVREYLEGDPEASATAVHKATGGRKQTVFEIVRRLKESGSHSPEPPGTTPSGQGRLVVPPVPPSGGPGTPPPDPTVEVVPTVGNHRWPEILDCPVCDEPKGARRAAGVAYFNCGHMLVLDGENSRPTETCISCGEKFHRGTGNSAVRCAKCARKWTATP